MNDQPVTCNHTVTSYVSNSYMALCSSQLPTGNRSDKRLDTPTRDASLAFRLPMSKTTQDWAKACSRVIEALHDPSIPIKCVVLLLGNFHNLSDVWVGMTSTGRRSAEAERLYGEYASTFIRWIAYRRTIAELRGLMDLACSCSPLERRAVWHTRSQVFSSQAADAGDSPFASCLEQGVNLLAAFVDTRRHSNKDIARPNHMPMRHDKIPVRTQWPNDIEEILPYGAENTIRSIALWLHLDMDAIVLELFVKTLESIFDLTSPLTLPYIITSDTLKLQGILPIMDSACRGLEMDSSTGFLHSETFRFNCRVNSIMLLRTTSRILFKTSIVGCNYIQRRIMFESCAKEVVDLCKRAAKALVDNSAHFDSKNTKDASEIDPYLTEFHDLLAQEAALWQGVRPAPDSIVDFTTVWRRTLENINHRLYAHRCSSPECAKTFLDTWPFKYCGVCRVDVYCSRRCQKVAWAHPIVPHRSICAIVRRLCVKNRLPRTHAMLLLRVEDPPTTFEEGLARLVLKQYADQTQYEIATSCE
jgi:hypothetical protein